MAKHIIFFIHGMGNHDNTWHEDGLKTLSKAWAEFDNLKKWDLDERIEAIPIVYNDVFETWRQEMASDFDAFKSALLGPAPDIATEDQGQIKKISKQLDKIGSWIGAGEPNFVWSHAMDVILYRFIIQIRMAVDTSVVKQIMQRVNQGNFQSWSIVAHSLGTSIAHNSLNSLYSTGLGDVAALASGETRPRALMMVANTSRVLQRPGAKVYDSAVKPGVSTDDRTCGYYLNVRHKLDPISQVRPFNKSGWPDASTYISKRYQHIEPGHIKFSKSDLMKVHNFEHYLINPRVHVPLFRAIMGDVYIPNEEFKEAKAGFNADQLTPGIKQVRGMLENKLPAPGGSWDVVIELFKKLS